MNFIQTLGANNTGFLPKWTIPSIKRISRATTILKSLNTVDCPQISLETVDKLLLNYINTCDIYCQVNQEMGVDKCRMPNFPSEISENIAKHAIRKCYGVTPAWNTTKDVKNITTRSGDLHLAGLTFEVKGFASTGPTSFGPTEKFDQLYFVDSTDYKNRNFIVWRIPISNTSDVYRNIKVSKTETMGDQCVVGKRPRQHFSKIKEQLGDCIEKIFEGNFSELY